MRVGAEETEREKRDVGGTKQGAECGYGVTRPEPG